MNDEKKKPFSEDQYYSEFKRIRNKFRKFNSLSIITKCIEYLHHPAKNNLEELEKHPWFVLLLMKWVLIDDWFDIHKKRSIDNNTTLSLIQATFDLSTVARLPNDFDHHTLFMRGMANQQFMYQEKFSFSNFARQQLLFNELESNSHIQKSFVDNIGLDIKTFLELSLALLTRFVATNEKTVSHKWFSTLHSEYSCDQIEKILNALSLPILSIRKKLRENDSGKRLAQEFYEQTPFVRFPLIRNTNECICIHKNILYKCLEHFVYDFFRENDSQSFMSKYGELFEKYVGKIIDYSGCCYVSENEIRKLLTPRRKVVDYIIIEQDANIFIDAKAVEMSYKGKTSHLAEIVRDRVKVSIIKAIEQAHDVLDQIHNNVANLGKLKIKEKNYLLVVTYKELYLSKGKTFYENVAKNKIDEIYSKYSESETIPPENMFYVTIEEFELLMEYVRSVPIDLSECLETIKKDDADHQTSKFLVTQHLWSWKANNPPSFLLEKTQDTFQKFQTIIDNK